jgi:Cdc6-like AAA superfamily ATPase
MEFTLGIPATGENFVDRAEQLDLMLSVTEAALRGKAQNSVAFLGGAGIGKTSLLLEGARRIKAQYGEQTIPIVILGGETSNEMHFLEQVRQTLGIPQKCFVEWLDLGEYLFEQVAF